MTKAELREYFEENYLENTCFDSLNDLLNDKSTLDVNMPRALIALELKGVWRGINGLNTELKARLIP